MPAVVRAAVLVAPRQMEVREFPRPGIGPDDGLLRVERSGICGSDVEQFKGHLGADRLPMIPGHEPIGLIDEVGERAAKRWNVEPGDRVALEILIPCRVCDLCLMGRYMACPNKHASHGYTPLTQAPAIWGGHAEYVYLHPNSIVHKVRKDISPDLAVMFNPLGAGVRWAVHLGGIQLGETILILGPGQRGLCAVIAARYAGAGTIIVTGLGRDRKKLALAREFGADHTIDVEQDNVVERVREITRGVGADVVLDVTPMATQPVKDALEAVRHGGRVVFAGLKGGRTMEFASDWIIRKGATVVGAFGVDARAYTDAIKIIEAGTFPLEKMHTHTFGLDDAGYAFDVMAGDVPGEEAVHVTIAPNGASELSRRRPEVAAVGV
jgi:threonine dehydrogenase-like Zn-dependent dehydrogenase